MSLRQQRRKHLRRRERIGVLLIAAQIVGIARMPFVRDRFFAWSPHDQRTDVTIVATWQGVLVSQKDVAQRYGLPSIDWHAAGNVDRIVEIAERRAAPDRRWHVRLRTAVNGRPGVERVMTPDGTLKTVRTASMESVES